MANTTNPGVRHRAVTPTIEMHNAPDKAGISRMLTKLERMLVDILVHLEFTGTWSLTFGSQVPGTASPRFSARKVDTDRGIEIRTRPGDNGTRWDSWLLPPPKYELDDVFKALKTVPTSARIPRVLPMPVQDATGKKKLGKKVPLEGPPPSDYAELVAKVAQKLGLPVPPIHVGDDMFVRVYEVTAEMVFPWLTEDCNKSNRNLSPTSVNKYGEDMHFDFWKLTHQGFAFDHEGHLVDGQSRSAAIFDEFAVIRIPIWIYAREGAAAEAQRGIDQTRTRNLHDAAKIWATELKWFGPTVKRFMVGDRTQKAVRSNSIIMDFMQQHAEAFAFLDEHFQSPKKGVRVAAVTAAVARAYYYVDHGRLAEFIKILYTQVARRDEDTAPIALIRHMTSQLGPGKQKRESEWITYTKATWAINAFMEKKPVDRLIRDNKDRYPLPDDPKTTLERKAIQDGLK